jgi:hypothetical protein
MCAVLLMKKVASDGGLRLVYLKEARVEAF